MSQAPGFRGMPSRGHCSSAATSASWARSSAMPRSRTMRVMLAMSLGAWIAGEWAVLVGLSALAYADGGLAAVGIAGAAYTLPAAPVMMVPITKPRSLKAKVATPTAAASSSFSRMARNA